MPVFVGISRRVSARAVEQLERARVAAARARDRGTGAARSRCCDSGRPGPASSTVSSGASIALEVGDQHFDAALGQRARVMSRMVSAKMPAPPSGRSSRSTEVITTYFSAIFATASPTRARLVDVERRRPAVRDRAVGARARADVAEDHERRGAVVPAFADVRAARVLADGVELEVAHDALAAAGSSRDPGARTFSHSGLAARGMPGLVSRGRMMRSGVTDIPHDPSRVGARHG